MWIDKAHNALVYDTANPETILRVVPGARSLSNGYVACPIDLYNLQLLRYLKYPVIPPMEGNYDWPGRYKPYEAQRITANFLCLHPRSFCLSDMGTGKTLAALWAADFVMGQAPVGAKTLIVAPLSTLQRVWADAIFQNFMHRRKAIVLHGSAAKRKALLAEPADFYIINYDGLSVIANELLARPDIRLVICDEASAYRDGQTKRHKLARKVIAPRDYLWLMTGTPTPNGPTDAHGMAKLVNNAFGESFTSFKDRCMMRVSMWKWIPRQGSHLEAHKLLQPSIRFAIEDCADLPPIITELRDVELSPEQAKAYQQMKRELQLVIKSGTPVNAPNEAVLRMKLIQISCGAIYSGANPNREVHHIDAKPRVAACREVIEQSNEKIIIFAPLTSVLHLLNKELKEYSREVVNGEVSHKKRSEIFRAFQQDANPRILIADPGTMAHGLDLYAATTVIWYAPTDKTELYLQANKRIHRPGQTKSCIVVQLAATAVEREIYRRLAANESMQGVILKLAQEGE
jgi:SNF2 family DNA or RNA helicase